MKSIIAFILLVTIVLSFTILAMNWTSGYNQISPDELAEVKQIIHDYPSLQNRVRWCINNFGYVNRFTYEGIKYQGHKIQQCREIGIKDEQ